MARTIREVMTTAPAALPLNASLTEAARLMRDEEVGSVLVAHNGRLCGLLTERDIVVRAVATGRDLTGTRLAEVCSAGIVTVGPGDGTDVALGLMREHSLRRLPVVEDGRPVGIVSIGDLAPDRGGAPDGETFDGADGRRVPQSR
jgi:signal-transduction protein with cAMP-binding, CBS, and nucleotidyltransferase domain